MAARKPASRRASAKPATVIERTPNAELIAAAIGLVLTLAILVYSVWQGLTTTGDPPALSVEPLAIRPVGPQTRVEIEVRNAAAGSAAAVEVEGVLSRGGAEVERARATFDYVPGMGSARGGLMFRNDPAAGRLDLAVKGYALP